MNSYNGVSGEERLAFDKNLKILISQQRLPKPVICEKCGQTKGQIQIHSEYYKSYEREDLEYLCQLCHLMWHCRRFKSQFEWYDRQVKSGVRFCVVNPPVLFKALGEYRLDSFLIKESETIDLFN